MFSFKLSWETTLTWTPNPSFKPAYKKPKPRFFCPGVAVSFVTVRDPSILTESTQLETSTYLPTALKLAYNLSTT